MARTLLGWPVQLKAAGDFVICFEQATVPWIPYLATKLTGQRMEPHHLIIRQRPH
jgi:hypothetical protein